MNDKDNKPKRAAPNVKEVECKSMLAKPILKEHMFSRLASDLRVVARKYDRSDQLRSHIVLKLKEYIDFPS